MAAYESQSTLYDLIGDADVAEIIEHRLVPAPFEQKHTKKYLIDGLPEVVVRNTPGEPLPEDRNRVETAFSRLPSYGSIAALPYIPVEQAGEVYVFTRRVHGADLANIVSPDTSDLLLHDIDRQWAQMVNYIRRSRTENFPCAADILGPDQHMYGWTADNSHNRVQLVDLGQWAFEYAASPDSGVYERAVITAANVVVELEQSFRRGLPLTRREVDYAAQLARNELGTESDEHLRALLNVARYALRQGVVVDYEDDEFVTPFSDDMYMGEA